MPTRKERISFITDASVSVGLIATKYYSMIENEELPPWQATKEMMELEMMEQALKEAIGNATLAAQILNLKRTTFDMKIKKLREKWGGSETDTGERHADAPKFRLPPSSRKSH